MSWMWRSDAGDVPLGSLEGVGLEVVAVSMFLADGDSRFEPLIKEVKVLEWKANVLEFLTVNVRDWPDRLSEPRT